MPSNKIVPSQITDYWFLRAFNSLDCQCQIIFERKLFSPNQYRFSFNICFYGENTERLYKRQTQDFMLWQSKLFNSMTLKIEDYTSQLNFNINAMFVLYRISQILIALKIQSKKSYKARDWLGILKSKKNRKHFSHSKA